MNKSNCFGCNPCFWGYPNQKHNKLTYHPMEVKAGDVNENNGSSTTQRWITIGVTLVVALLGAACSQRPLKLASPFAMYVPFSILDNGIDDGHVNEVQFTDGSPKVFFNMNSLDQNGLPLHIDMPASYVGNTSFGKWQFYTRSFKNSTSDLRKKLKRKKIIYGIKPSLIGSIMVFFKEVGLVLHACYLMITVQSKRTGMEETSVTFDDIKGVESAKSALMEIVKILEGDPCYKKLGVRLPRGILLTGPSGTGKTLLARTLAKKARVHFLYTSASEFVEVYGGNGAARVRDLFREARKHQACIIFIDEIDAIGGEHGLTPDFELLQTLNQLLTEMDGYKENENLVVIAATNRPEVLDPALTRSGRLTKEVVVDVPDVNGQKEIFALYLGDVPMEGNMEDICQDVALGADLNYIADESPAFCARRDDILKAVETVRSKGQWSSSQKQKRSYSDQIPQDDVQGTGQKKEDS